MKPTFSTMLVVKSYQQSYINLTTILGLTCHHLLPIVSPFLRAFDRRKTKAQMSKTQRKIRLSPPTHLWVDNLRDRYAS